MARVVLKSPATIAFDGLTGCCTNLEASGQHGKMPCTCPRPPKTLHPAPEVIFNEPVRLLLVVNPKTRQDPRTFFRNRMQQFRVKIEYAQDRRCDLCGQDGPGNGSTVLDSLE